MVKIKPEYYVNLKGKDWQRCPLARFIEKVRYTAYGCWEWSGGRFKSGYGKFSVGRRADKYAHRWAHRLFKGEIPAGYHTDHLCRNPCCVNPDHLDVVPPRENVRRGTAGRTTGERNSSKTHCRNGHSYSGENLYIYPNGQRGCRTCNRAAQAAYAARKKAHVDQD